METTVAATHARAYTPATLAPILTASSARLPEALRSADLIEALASRIWTFDGQPYLQATLTGSCDDGNARCDLQVKGLPAFAADRDAADRYTFTFDVRTRVLSDAGEPSLRGLPPGRTAELDAAVRRAVPDRVRDLALLATQWALPPPADAYLLRYGTGDEEGDPQLIVRFDRDAGRVLSVEDASGH